MPSLGGVSHIERSTLVNEYGLRARRSNSYKLRAKSVCSFVGSKVRG